MKTILLFALSLLLSLSVSDVCAQERVYDISQFGLKACLLYTSDAADEL